MAAAMGWNICIKSHRILSKLSVPMQILGPGIRYISALPRVKAEAELQSTRFLFSVARALFFHRPSKKSSAKQNENSCKTRVFSDTGNRLYSRSSSGKSPDPWGPSNKPDGERPLKLMDFAEIVWPHPMKFFKNMFFSFLIRGYFDNTFTPAKFLKGAEQAMNCVSNFVSVGDFDSIEGLVSREAIREVSQSYRQLSPKQRKFLAVQPKDLYLRFIYEIGMIFDDETQTRFVEITAVFQGNHQLAEMKAQDGPSYFEDMKNAQDQAYVCNYRFIREFTKGVEDQWTINKLNHFLPKEHVQNTSIFRR